MWRRSTDSLEHVVRGAAIASATVELGGRTDRPAIGAAGGAAHVVVGAGQGAPAVGAAGYGAAVRLGGAASQENNTPRRQLSAEKSAVATMRPLPMCDGRPGAAPLFWPYTPESYTYRNVESRLVKLEIWSAAEHGEING